MQGKGPDDPTVLFRPPLERFTWQEGEPSPQAYARLRRGPYLIVWQGLITKGARPIYNGRMGLDDVWVYKMVSDVWGWMTMGLGAVTRVLGASRRGLVLYSTRRRPSLVLKSQYWASNSGLMWGWSSKKSTPRRKRSPNLGTTNTRYSNS